MTRLNRRNSQPVERAVLRIQLRFRIRKKKLNRIRERIENRLIGRQISRIQAGFKRIIVFRRKYNNLIATKRMAAFILNPYDQKLDLTTREHLKLYTDGCEGLEKDVRFDGKREHYQEFVKLVGARMERI